MVFMTWHSGTLTRKRSGLTCSVKMMLKLNGYLYTSDETMLITELSKLPGVKSVRLDLDTNRLLVSLDQGKTSVERIAYQVNRLGYSYVKRV